MLYLTLRHYEYICATAQHGSLSAAAEALHVSQPALSTALSRIEEHLGQALFLRRRGAPLTLTSEGRAFAERAQLLLEDAARLEAPGGTNQIARRLVLGCFSDLAPLYLAPALLCLRAAFPDLSLATRMLGFSELTAALAQGEIDLAITYDLGLDASFQRQILANRRPVAMIPPDHPLAGSASTRLRILAQEPLILSQEGLSLQHMLNLFHRQGLHPRIAHRAGSLELLRSLAANGEGVGIAYSAPDNPTSYDGKPLVTLVIDDAEAREPIVLASHGSPHPEAPSFKAAQLLTAHFADQPLADRPRSSSEPRASQ